MAPKRKKGRIKEDPATKNFYDAENRLMKHPLFFPIWLHSHILRDERSDCPPDGWALVDGLGFIHVHPSRRAEPEEWLYVLAHCALHLGFGHFTRPDQDPDRSRAWNAACDVFITRFLDGLRLGTPPASFQNLPDLPGLSEEKLYRRFCQEGIPDEFRHLGTGSPDGIDMVFPPYCLTGWERYYLTWQVDWGKLLGEGLAQAAYSAVNVAGGREERLGAGEALTPAQAARLWFINSYPLLGALAASFKVIEDPRICTREQVMVAAVDAELKEIYMNPAAGLDERECRFVMAHELLHVGLRHTQRRMGRDAYFWNVACDYVINAWLVEMGLGAPPQLGLLYDPELKGESAESVYDRIVTDLRRYRKLATLRGIGLGDILERGRPDWWNLSDGTSLDDFYRRCLAQGLSYHQSECRGLLPAGLVEEIRALSQPPITWDVALAQWFDHYFSPQEKTRTYARQSRRQSSTPDIPRPRYVPPWDSDQNRTFGVVLDTSGSMDRHLLAKALGSISSYSLSRDVPLVRVVFCDAVTYDQGYMSPEEIAGRVKVRGRGGTILQPGIDLLEKAADFPKEGPLLIITDGYCDKLNITRPHAFLIPQGHSLPFIPRGEVFRLE